jgi:hypothetical protein
VPVETADRDVVRGVVGCPVCQAEFQIIESVLYMAVSRTGGQAVSEGALPPDRLTDLPSYDASALASFLALEGRGGYAVLAGRAARNAADLVTQLPGVHVVAVNPPEGIAPAGMVSVIRTHESIPLRTRHARAVALGADVAGGAWLAEAERVLLPGLRLVVEGEDAEPRLSDVLARGGGVLVGEKRAH